MKKNDSFNNEEDEFNKKNYIKNYWFINGLIAAVIGTLIKAIQRQGIPLTWIIIIGFFSWILLNQYCSYKINKKETKQ